MTTELQLNRDALADRVIVAVTQAFQKLAEHRTEIAELWMEFETLRPGETIKGCRTKTEFCEVHLCRTIRSVQYMLKGGNPRRGETISPPTLEVEVAPEIDLPPLTGDCRRDNQARHKFARALGHPYPYWEAGKAIIPFLCDDPVLGALINEQGRVLSLAGWGLFKDEKEEFEQTGRKAARLEAEVIAHLMRKRPEGTEE
jgi:hypothetical protein